MTYELAKQLKDAGYPQPAFDSDHMDFWIKGGEGMFFRPTLSELIEACHTRQLTIEQKWIEGSNKPQWFVSHWVYTIGPYDTLEETIAHLWLRINKKG
jgi:hypothetical protein